MGSNFLKAAASPLGKGPAQYFGGYGSAGAGGRRGVPAGTGGGHIMDGRWRKLEGGRRRRAGLSLRLSVLAVVAASAAACTTVTDFQTVLRVPEGAPARPAAEPEFPAVHELPAERENALLEPADQARVERELALARDRQSAGGRPDPAQVPKARRARKPPKTEPATGTDDQP